jgi:gamma-resorcylate decarboxylase
MAGRAGRRKAPVALAWGRARYSGGRAGLAYLRKSATRRLRSPAAMDAMGFDRVLFSADYPYESMREASGWFDNAATSDNDRAKIGYLNAGRLLPGLPEHIGKQA